MSTRTPVNARRALHAVSSLIAIGVAVIGPAACSGDPPFACTAEAGLGIGRFSLQSPPISAACAALGLPDPPPDSAPLPTTLGTVENPIPWWTAGAESLAIGVQAFQPDPEDPNYANEVGNLALKAEWIGARIQDAQNNAGLPNYPYDSAADIPSPPPTGTPTNNFPYAWGTFTTVTPDSAGVCHAEDMTSDMVYPDVPAHTGSDVNGNSVPVPVPDQPALHVKYAWSNVRVLVSAAAQGVITYASLTITAGPADTPDACVVSYDVSLLVPKVGCASSTAATPTADSTLCDPNPDGINNPYGSGISTSVNPVCVNVSNDPNDIDFECLPPTQANDPGSALQ